MEWAARASRFGRNVVNVGVAFRCHLMRAQQPLAPTQIGRALHELGMGWIGEHSPQAKGRVERSFQTAQDRLVKGLRVAGAKTLEQANAYLVSEYLPEWESRFAVVPACGDNAHRPLLAEHVLEAILCPVERRVIADDYTIRHEGKMFQIAGEQIRPRMRGSAVRVESRRAGFSVRSSPTLKRAASPSVAPTNRTFLLCWY
jgi:hypothetical protein